MEIIIVGYEAKHLYVKELLHFSDPTSDLYLPGFLKEWKNKIFLKKKRKRKI